MRDTAYLSADVTPIHAHDLALVQKFTALLSGAEKLPNGGLILGTDSMSNRPSTPALDFALEKADAVAQGAEVPEWDSHKRIDGRVLSALEGVDAWKIEGLSREEAKGIMEYYARSGMLRQQVDNKLVGEKWTLSGGGVIGELERGTVRMRV